jgi:hypothetical protein
MPSTPALHFVSLVLNLLRDNPTCKIGATKCAGVLVISMSNL